MQNLNNRNLFINIRNCTCIFCKTTMPHIQILQWEESLNEEIPDIITLKEIEYKSKYPNARISIKPAYRVMGICLCQHCGKNFEIECVKFGWDITTYYDSND